MRIYDRLFMQENPDADKETDFTTAINPESLVVLRGCRAEPGLAEARDDLPYQFEREGYFFRDPDFSADHAVFNRTVTLRDSWAKIESKTKG